MEVPSPSGLASTVEAVDDDVLERLNADIQRLRQQLEDKEEKLAAAKLKNQQNEGDRLQRIAGTEPVIHHEAVPSASVCIPFDLSLCGPFHIDIRL